MTELKLCPFCGGEVKLIATGLLFYNYLIEHKVKNDKCMFFDGKCFHAETETEAIKRWNKRFTGIGDKNGKKIYDGDLVKITTDRTDTYQCMYDYQNAVYIFNPTIADESDSAEETLRELRGIPYCENKNLEIEMIGETENG